MTLLVVREQEQEAIENEIAELEARLQEAKQRLAAKHSIASQTTPYSSPPTSSTEHYLLLLSDSALPLGSFAFSSGLESYKTHAGASASFSTFFPLSISSYASTTLPFVLAAHRDPTSVADLDDTYDAAVLCTVGRRASVAQGRALLAVWEKSFSAAAPAEARAIISSLRSLLSSSSSSSSHSSSNNPSATSNPSPDLPPPYSAHLPPLFGAVAALLGLSRQQTAYVFLLSHAKALVSAGVRAAMLGPYVAQRVLASAETRGLIEAVVRREWDTRVEAAGQCVPAMDLWVGRHEMLYSRIFNS